MQSAKELTKEERKNEDLSKWVENFPSDGK